MPLAEHSDSYLRGQLTVESLHYGQGKLAKFLHSLSDVGSFHPPSPKLDELKPPKGSASTPRMSASLFGFPLDAERPTPTPKGEATMRPSGGRFLGDLNQVGGWTVFAMSDRPSATEFAKPSEKTTFQVSEDAQKRLGGYERLFYKLLFITRQEAAARHVPLLKIEGLRAWSHEYQDDDGVVIHVEVQGNDEERFSVWEGISERINLLQGNLNSEEREFLMNEVSVIVDRQ